MFDCDKPGCLILEYCPGGDLFNLIQKARQFRPSHVRFYGACILEAIEYLHENHILFKDLKSENVIISKDGYAKLIDFSLSQSKGGSEIENLVPCHISAPEVIRQQNFTEKSDWWGFGCLLYEMAVGYKPFEGISAYQTKNLILNSEPEIPENVDQTLKNLIKSLLEKNPEKRLKNA